MCNLLHAVGQYIYHQGFKLPSEGFHFQKPGRLLNTRRYRTMRLDKNKTKDLE